MIFALKMNFNRISAVLLGLSLLCGCHPNRSLPPTPQPTPVPTQLTRQINSSLRSAVKFLIEHQSPDGAWRSETYGFLKDGASLSPHVAALLNQVSAEAFHTKAPLERARHFLRTVSQENLIYPVYTAADISRVFAHDPEIQSHWLAYLRQHQLTENLDWRLGDLEYGGWSYAIKPPQRPADLKNRGPWDWSNLSATLAAMEAFREAGLVDADPAISPALLFAERCQNLPPEGYQGEEKFDDGGFFFSPAEPIRNKAGSNGKDRYNMTRFNSYGSATVDGMLLLLDCGLGIDHPRIEAGKDWLRKHYDVQHNPGNFVAGNEDLRDATYFYYCRGLARATQRLTWRQWLVKNKSIDVAVEIATALINRQKPDGSWRNNFTDGREDDPLVATPMAAEALLICLRMINNPIGPATTQSIAAVLKAASPVVRSVDALGIWPAFAVSDRAGIPADRGAGNCLDLPRRRFGISRRTAARRRPRPLSHRRLGQRRPRNLHDHRGR